MNKDEIIAMARQAGVRDDENIFEFSQYKYLETFAKLVASAERKEWEKEFAGMGEWACVYLLEERNK